MRRREENKEKTVMVRTEKGKNNSDEGDRGSGWTDKKSGGEKLRNTPHLKRRYLTDAKPLLLRASGYVCVLQRLLKIESGVSI